jgi:hypothetical protein
MSMTQSLLDFILNLLRDPEAKAAFMADPDRALADAGLSDVCSEDVSDAMSYVAEYHPVALVGPREYNLGNSAVVQHAEDHGEHRGDWHGHDDRPGPHDGVIQQLQYITNNYAYTDSHDTLVDKSVNQNIWNKGTLAQSFDDHSVTATDHSVAAGRDFDGTAVTGDGNVVGHDNSVGNTSYVDDNSIRGSFNGNNVADHGGVAGDNADGNVTQPYNSEVATTGSKVSDSHDDIHTTIKDSGNTYDHSDNSYDNVGNTNHHDHVAENSFNTVESHNEDSVISHTHQDGLINANVSPVVNLPIEHNDVDILNHG